MSMDTTMVIPMGISVKNPEQGIESTARLVPSAHYPLAGGESEMAFGE